MANAISECRFQAMERIPLPRKRKHSFQSPVVDIIRALDAHNRFAKIAPRIVGAMKMNFSKTKDERLLAFYENIRRQVDLDMRGRSLPARR
jgi:hypothetical protein